MTDTGTAIDWLERIASDRSALETLSVDDRTRLHRALAALTTVDPRASRKRRKAKRLDRIRQEEAVLNDTGIRTLRRRPAVTTPNVFPPVMNASPGESHAGPSVDRVC